MSIEARRMTRQEHEQGYMICGCGKFAHVFRSAVLRQLPEGYNGELCPECKLWMVAVDKLPMVDAVSGENRGDEIAVGAKMVQARKQKTMEFSVWRNLMICNSEKAPHYVNVKGQRMWWTGVGVVNCGTAQGDEVVIVPDEKKSAPEMTGRKRDADSA